MVTAPTARIRCADSRPPHIRVKLEGEAEEKQDGVMQLESLREGA